MPQYYGAQGGYYPQYGGGAAQGGYDQYAQGYGGVYGQQGRYNNQQGYNQAYGKVQKFRSVTVSIADPFKVNMASTNSSSNFSSRNSSSSSSNSNSKSPSSNRRTPKPNPSLLLRSGQPLIPQLHPPMPLSPSRRKKVAPKS